MAGLDRDDLLSRLQLDYRVVSRMHSPLMQVTAYRNSEDIKKRRNPITSEQEGHLATHYFVDYHIRTMVGRGVYSDRTGVQIDLQAGNNYPFSEPGCWVVEGRMPWSPHFLKGRPICLGEIWLQAHGTMLLGQMLVHIAKLLNFDEVARGRGYVGYNGEAIEYWKNVLGYQPITKNLPYPELPDEIIHTAPPEPKRTFIRKGVMNAGADARPALPAPPKGATGLVALFAVHGEGGHHASLAETCERLVDVALGVSSRASQRLGVDPRGVGGEKNADGLGADADAEDLAQPEGEIDRSHRVRRAGLVGGDQGRAQPSGDSKVLVHLAHGSPRAK